MKNYIFIVEGSQDVALIGSILKVLKFKSVKNLNKLDSILNKLIIDKFPFDEDSLEVFNKIPSFYKNKDNFVCIINADGETNLLNRLDLSLEKFELEDYENITKVIVFCDADTKNRETKLNDIIEGSFTIDNELIFKKENLLEGNILLKDFEIINIPIDFYVLPDNENTGRLEEILLEIIEKEDKQLLEKVDEFLHSIPNKYKSKWEGENSKLDKTRISCV